MKNPFYWLGIRSTKDLLTGSVMFLMALASLYIGAASVGALPGLRPNSAPVVDITPVTFLVAISMALISIPWAAYVVLGLVLRREDKTVSEKTWTPKFSVLVPARNEEKVIGNLVGDLMRQTWANFEVIVICHNFSDKTYELVLKYHETDQRIHPIAFFGQKGKGAALNAGTKHSTGDVLVVLDADNRVAPDFLQSLADYFPRFDAVQTRIETSNADYNLVTKLASLEFTAFTDSFQRTRAGLGINVGLGGTGEAVKRSVLQAVGYWGNSLTEDFALFTRLTSKGYKIGWADNVEVFDEKAPWWFDMYKQRARWIKGHYQVAARNFRSFLRDPLNLHYLIAPVSIFGYYYSFFLGVVFLFRLPIRTSYLPVYVWLIPWAIFLAGMAITIAKKRGVRSLVFYPLLLVYLYHWIAVFAAVPFIRNWDAAKTEHGFYKDQNLEVGTHSETPVIVQ